MAVFSLYISDRGRQGESHGDIVLGNCVVRLPFSTLSPLIGQFELTGVVSALGNAILEPKQTCGDLKGIPFPAL